MAIRLIDQYPNRVGTPDADYPHGVPRNRSAPGAVDGTPFEQSWFRDQEGFFQGLLETAGIAPSGVPDTVDQSDYFDALVGAMHGVVEVDVGGVGDVTLGIYPSRVAALLLTGTLGADVDLIVPDTERLYTVIDETTGSFSVTVRTSAGSGVVIGEAVSVVRCDGTNVVGANPASDLGQNIAVFDTAGVTEWDVPAVLQAGLRKAYVEVIGAGGSGRSVSGSAARAIGGAAGGISKGLVDLTGVSSVAVTVGEGGEGVIPPGGNDLDGQPGGSSSFGAFMSASGGEGGVAIAATGGIGAGGDFNASLGDSTNQTFSQSVGNGATPGAGIGGGYNNTPEVAENAGNGRHPGAGGGGCLTASSAARRSGNGANGIVIVRY